MQEESSASKDKYEGMSPPELNGQLRELITSTFPDVRSGYLEQGAKGFDELITAANKIEERRQSSDMKKITFHELNQLLAHSNTTRAFREMALDDLERIFDVEGITADELDKTFDYINDQRNQPNAHIRYLLGLESLSPAGIFDPDNAVTYDIETSYYDLLKYDYQDREKERDARRNKNQAGFSKLLHRVKAPVGRSVTRALDRAAGLPENPPRDIEKRWKNEFNLKYYSPLTRVTPSSNIPTHK